MLFRLLLILFIAHRICAETVPAQAGWAEVDITPPLGVEMGGRGPTETVGKKVLDPLKAQVLFLKDAKGAGFALVSFDLVGMPHELSDRIRTMLVHELGVDWNLTVVNVSHTHSGPQVNLGIMAILTPVPQNQIEYQNTVYERIVEATRAAAKSMHPVKADVFEGKSEIAINRRGHDKNGQPSMRPNPKGPIAEKLWVLKLTPLDGTAPAVIFSYACHPVIVYTYAGNAISADFPGFARTELRKALGEKTHLQFVQGLAGDVRPRALANIEKNSFRSAKPDDAPNVGKQLASDVMSALKSQPKTLNVNLAAALERPFLPRDAAPPRAQYEQLLANAKGPRQANIAKYWLQRYDTGIGFSKGDAWPTGLIRLADNQWICYLAGEPCVEWGPKISEWLAPRDIVFFGYSQETITYLPTAELLPEGGYEVLECNRARGSSCAQFAPGINDSIHHSLMRQLSAIEIVHTAPSH
jgi:neutral ceramidase